MLGGWKKEYFQEKIPTIIKSNFLKSFSTAVIAAVMVMGLTIGLQYVYPPVFNYSLSFSEPQEDTIGTDESGSLIQTDADGTVTELGFTKNWGIKKVLILVNWMLIFYLLPLFCLFMTSGDSRSNDLSVGKVVFYVVCLFILGSTISSILSWVLLFSFYDLRCDRLYKKLIDTGLSFDKVDDKFQKTMSPYVFWFLFILFSATSWVTML
jgi:hypothetical protein